jgi:hypothetical protein
MKMFWHLTGLLALLTFPMAGHPEAESAAGGSAAIAAAMPPLPDVIYFESAIGDVEFPHTRHQKMRCKRCHHQIHARELDTPHDEYLEVSWIQCGMCHEKDSEFSDTYYKCSGCHHAEPESIVDETISSKVVIHQSCWKCHKSGTGVKASKGCSYCHEQQEKELAWTDENS